MTLLDFSLKFLILFAVSYILVYILEKFKERLKFKHGVIVTVSFFIFAGILFYT